MHKDLKMESDSLDSGLRPLFSIYDVKAQFYHEPLVFKSRGEAIRWFADGVNRVNDKSQLYLHPEDFTLFHIGQWNDLKGLVEPCVPYSLGKGLDFKNK